MQVSVENVGNLGRKLTVRIPAARLEDTVRNRVQEMGRNARLKGFRPGKVPTKVIEQRFGAQIRGEALSELIGSSFQEAVSNEKLRPAMQPSISTSGKPDNGEIEYTASFEVMPEIGAIDVSGLEIVKQVSSVEDADIDTMIQTLRVQRQTWNPIDRPAQAGDMVLFEFAAQASDFRYPETGTDRVGTIVGSDALFKGLEDELLGHVVDDEFEKDLDFPSDFRIEGLAGKSAHASFKIVRVQEPKLPELDDAFLSTFGVFEGGLEKFREDVRSNLERELEAALASRLKASAVEKLIDAHADLELPNGLIESEARELAKQSAGGKQENVAHEPFMASARRRVAGGILLAEIARQNEIRVDMRRVSASLSAIASTYEEPEQVVELYSKDAQLMSGLQSRVLEDQVIDWIAEKAMVSEHKLTFSEIMRPGA
ncbi:MAG TPA: trigger factor [Dokdonella sp.]|uniref:trigger factor n=1 Tax=Dokdonella sp. TaxID=2291710 RepID=UPI002D7FB22D|nr:trigger factor [Dokdonella sp.]HET9033632.1 trigger factor [Dokdonella sp.]